jgi:hypothetical protein
MRCLKPWAYPLGSFWGKGCWKHCTPEMGGYPKTKFGRSLGVMAAEATVARKIM